MNATDTISGRKTEAILSPSLLTPLATPCTHGALLGLPPLNESGFLPKGVHESNLEDMENRFALTSFRKNLWYKCVAFLGHATVSGQFRNAYFGGGFVTSKPQPLDIDFILETEAAYGPDAFKAMEPFFAKGLDTILEIYSVHLHFWCKGFPRSIWDCRDFFQYIRPFESLALGLTPETRKGIVRIRLSESSGRGAFNKRTKN